MFRRTVIFALCALGLPTIATQAEVLTQTKYVPFRLLDVRDPAWRLDMGEVFQRHPAPGPVATFTIRLPEPDERRNIDLGGGLSREIQTFKTLSGERYDRVSDLASADDFVRRDFAFDVQLFPEDAPLTVANFMTYSRRGDYNRSIVHRSVPDYVVQAGGFRFSREDDGTEAPLWLVQSIDTVPMEFERPNTPGTLAMARPAGGMARNQWFFNIRDNSAIHRPQLGNAFAVFGEATADGLGVLREINRVSRFNLTGFGGSFGAWSETPLTLPFASLPAENPEFTDRFKSLVVFESITVSEGNPDGITYNWAPVEGTEEDPVVADVDSFDIRFEENHLVVEPVDTGRLVIEVTGSHGGDEATFSIDLSSEDPRVRQFFSGLAVTVTPGHTYGVAFLGEFDGREFPWIVHPRHHNLYAATEAVRERYHFYDPRLRSWLFVRPARANYFYIHRLGEWVFFANQSGSDFDPDHPDRDDRWFYRFPVVDEEGEEIAVGEWVQGSEL